MHAQLLQSYSTLCNPWTVAHQAPLSMGFPRQEYWNGLPFRAPGIFLTQGSIESPTLAGGFFRSQEFQRKSMSNLE